MSQPCDLCGGRGGNDRVVSDDKDLKFLPAFAQFGALLGADTCGKFIDGIENLVAILGDKGMADLLGLPEPMPPDVSCAAFQRLGVYCGCEPADPPCKVCPGGGELLNPDAEIPDTLLEELTQYVPTCGFFENDYLPNNKESDDMCVEGQAEAVGTCECEGGENPPPDAFVCSLCPPGMSIQYPSAVWDESTDESCSQLSANLASVADNAEACRVAKNELLNNSDSPTATGSFPCGYCLPGSSAVATEVCTLCASGKTPCSDPETVVNDGDGQQRGTCAERAFFMSFALEAGSEECVSEQQLNLDDCGCGDNLFKKKKCKQVKKDKKEIKKEKKDMDVNVTIGLYNSRNVAAQDVLDGAQAANSSVPYRVHIESVLGFIWKISYPSSKKNKNGGGGKKNKNGGGGKKNKNGDGGKKNKKGGRGKKKNKKGGGKKKNKNGGGGKKKKEGGGKKKEEGGGKKKTKEGGGKKKDGGEDEAGDRMLRMAAPGFVSNPALRRRYLQALDLEILSVHPNPFLAAGVDVDCPDLVPTVNAVTGAANTCQKFTATFAVRAAADLLQTAVVEDVNAAFNEADKNGNWTKKLNSIDELATFGTFGVQRDDEATAGELTEPSSAAPSSSAPSPLLATPSPTTQAPTTAPPTKSPTDLAVDAMEVDVSFALYNSQGITAAGVLDGTARPNPSSAFGYDNVIETALGYIFDEKYPMGGEGSQRNLRATGLSFAEDGPWRMSLDGGHITLEGGGRKRISKSWEGGVDRRSQLSFPGEIQEELFERVQTHQSGPEPHGSIPVERWEGFALGLLDSRLSDNDHRTFDIAWSAPANGSEQSRFLQEGDGAGGNGIESGSSTGGTDSDGSTERNNNTESRDGTDGGQPKQKLDLKLNTRPLLKSGDDITCPSSVPPTNATGAPNTCQNFTATLKVQATGKTRELKKSVIRADVVATYKEASADGTLTKHLKSVDGGTFSVIAPNGGGGSGEGLGARSEGGGDGGSVNIGAIIGGVVGGVVLLCCCLGLFAYFRRKRGGRVDENVANNQAKAQAEAWNNDENTGYENF